MGVTGLWKLIEPCGQPVPVEMLEGKILAVDISIWLHQAVKGFQDNRGSALANSHLLGLFHRLCKLMYYRIKPIFVFDGKVPTLKIETIAKRNMKRNTILKEADRIQGLLLESLAKEEVVQQALGPKAAAELLKASAMRKNRARNRPDIDDMFKLPDLPPIEEDNENELNTSLETTGSSETDNSFEESKPSKYYNQNLQAIDVKSKHFQNLPSDIKYEILIDIRETRKLASWGKFRDLPTKGNDFSQFQMKRLLKRRQVQACIDEVQKEMDGVRHFTMSELESIFSEDGIIEPSTLPNQKRICSDESTRFLLVRDLKKTLQETAKAEADEKAKQEQEKFKEEQEKLKGEEPKPETSASALEKEQIQLELGDDYDDDLQKAIQMSLDQSAVYSKNDYEHEGELKLSREQRKHFRNSAFGLAKSYMIEHAGLNTEILNGMLENTQNFSMNEEMEKLEYVDEDEGTESNIQPVVTKITTDSISKEVKLPPPSAEAKTKILETEDCVDVEEKIKLNETVDKTLPIAKESTETTEADEIGVISDSSSDSELEEVSCDSPKVNTTLKDNSSKAETKSGLEIFVDPSKGVTQDDDLFADVFLATKKQEEEKPEPKIELTSKTLDLTDILMDLKKQASEVNKISLTDIEIDPSIIEISDEETMRFSQNPATDIAQGTASEEASRALQNCDQNSKPTGVLPKPDLSEIIEIADDDEVKPNTSPIHKTPSKTKSISDFFETQYVIKRSAEKLPEGIEEEVPKMKSPFFIKKTPKSSGKKNQEKKSITDDEASPLKRTKKAAKQLFEKSTEDDVEMEPLKAEPEHQTTLEEAANILKETKSREELENMASTIGKEKADLEIERNRQDRMGMTINEKMYSECMELLRLFGVPYIVAPMEAEAQCAFLDAMQLTNGTITDDSDIWLFGGRTVYKNFFAQDKHVLEFKNEKIENSFNVDRKKLIQLALLVGSDYTTGINGIGSVTALEILASFSGNETKDAIASQQTANILSALQNFRDWWASAGAGTTIGNTTKHKLRNKLKNIELTEGFPSLAVVEAYLKPTVDDSEEAFSWGTPDSDSIVEFARTNMGWTRLKTSKILEPVLKKFHEKKSQATIKNYFAVKSVSCTKDLPVSKRVKNAINKMSTDYKSDEDETNNKSPLKSKRGKRKKPVEPIPPGTATTSITNDLAEVVPKKAQRVSKRNPKPPPPSNPISLEIIPQREKDLEEMKRKKEMAATVLKQSKPKKVKK